MDPERQTSQLRGGQVERVKGNAEHRVRKRVATQERLIKLSEGNAVRPDIAVPERGSRVVDFSNLQSGGAVWTPAIARIRDIRKGILVDFQLSEGKSRAGTNSPEKENLSQGASISDGKDVSINHIWTPDKKNKKENPRRLENLEALYIY
jgi:hypothetical protein